MTVEIVIAALVAFVAGALLGGFVVFHSDMEMKIMEDRSGYKPQDDRRSPSAPPSNPPNQGSAGVLPESCIHLRRVDETTMQNVHRKYYCPDCGARWRENLTT